MYHNIISFSICFSLLFHSAFSFAQANDNKILNDDRLLNIAKSFFLAKEKTYQEQATKEDIETFLNFCTDSIQYDHILSFDKKFSFTGKDQLRNGFLLHLGETRNAKIEIVNHIERQNIVIIESRLYREIKTNQGWEKDSKKTIVTIMEFDNNKKIKRLTDYL